LADDEEIALGTAELARRDPDVYRRIVEETEDLALIGLDIEGHIAGWNRGAERLTGYAGQEIIGAPVSRLFLPEDAQRGRPEEQMRQALAEGRATEEGWRLRKSGTRFWAGSVMTPQYGNKGEPAGFCWIMRDLSRCKRAEEELARRNAELEQVTAVVSHDLRSPLLAISGCAQLLKEQFDTALAGEGAELIGMIQEGVDRTGRIIKDLLAFARATPARELFECVDTEQVLATSLLESREAIARNAAGVTHDPLPKVRGNARQLGRVFTHLISNALEYRREEPPRVHLSAVERGGEWEFSVRDNGIGIEPMHLERIFALFQRLHEEGRRGGGSGVGLSICRKIIEHHQGRIWVESQPGHGSTVFFTIPRPA
jgi:PAS domain S-box-containing protein